ncbi:MAG: response regulator [Calditrichaeota bacterium]|nr:response regulator [Calditrichota bacterium]
MAKVPKTILFVEDSPTMRRIIANSLRQVGFDEIIEAENGVDALEKLEGKEVDLVVTDWNMPEMNGAELVKTLREMPPYAEVPIVMITTRGMKDDVMTAMKLGVNGYIVKPFTPEILQEKLRSILR